MHVPGIGGIFPPPCITEIPLGVGDILTALTDHHDAGAGDRLERRHIGNLTDDHAVALLALDRKQVARLAATNTAADTGIDRLKSGVGRLRRDPRFVRSFRRTNADLALEETPSIEKCIVVQRTGNEVPMQDGRDLWWHEEMAADGRQFLDDLAAMRLLHLTLSGGEQQRVAIARAIAKRPDVLLCDEPTGALDSKTGVVVLEALETVNRELGTTTVLITHNADIARMADRVIHLHSGSIVEDQLQPEPAAASELQW